MFACGTLIALKGVIGGAAPGGFGALAAGWKGRAPSPIPSHRGVPGPGGTKEAPEVTNSR